MTKKRTTKYRSDQRSQVLKMRVVTPEIIWFDTMRYFTKFFKWFAGIAMLSGVCYGAWIFTQRSFIDNPKYELRIVKLSPNTVMNELDVVKAGEISLNSSIFDVSVKNVERKISLCSGVKAVKVRRVLPNTIEIDITERKPFAWIQCESKQMIARNPEKGFVIDREGYLYQCPALQYEDAITLPIIVIPETDQNLFLTNSQIQTKNIQYSINFLEAAENVSGIQQRWIDVVRQTEKWSYKVLTKDGIEATFGLENIDQKMKNFLLSIDHASDKGWQITSINLIPEVNFPVVLKDRKSDGSRRVSPNTSR
jgi:cell division septal protein FtsQ